MKVQIQFILRLATPGFGACDLEDHSSYVDLIDLLVNCTKMPVEDRPSNNLILSVWWLRDIIRPTHLLKLSKEMVYIFINS